VEREEIHDLTAAYALDALSPEEERAFEEHLRTCDACREEVARLRETAADLATASPAVPPPPALRERVLEQARAERRNVVPLRPRWAVPVAAAAAVAACAAVAFGVWAATLNGDLHDRTSALHQRDRLLAVLADPSAAQLALSGGHGRLYVTGGGQGALLVSRLPAAPAGKRYEAWVLAPGSVTPAGLFRGGGGAAVLLAAPVTSGTRVGVTLEPYGGSPQPTGPILARSGPVA
jgi:anti-sigma-K factor RskA